MGTFMRWSASATCDPGIVIEIRQRCMWSEMSISGFNNDGCCVLLGSMGQSRKLVNTPEQTKGGIGFVG